MKTESIDEQRSTPIPRARLKRLRSLNVSAFLLAVLGSYSHDARAFDYHAWCGGSPSIKDAGPLAETRVTCSFVDGSPAMAVYFHGINTWNPYSKLPVTASYQHDRCEIDLDDWKNEIAISSRAQIDGASGLTTYAHVNVCWTGEGGGNYGATDIRLADDMDYAAIMPPSEMYGSYYPRGVLVHEIGHQIALGHSDYFNTMRHHPSSPIGPVPYPDDVLGVAAVFGGKEADNLFASGQRWEGSMINNHPTDEDVCVTEPFVAHVTVANPGWDMGTYGVTYDQRVFLAENDDGTSPAVDFNWLGATTQHQDWSQFAFSISTDGVPPGSYFLFHGVDSSNQVAELREDDNVLRYTGKILVNDCNFVLALHSSNSIEYL